MDNPYYRLPFPLLRQICHIRNLKIPLSSRSYEILYQIDRHNPIWSNCIIKHTPDQIVQLYKKGSFSYEECMYYFAHYGLDLTAFNLPSKNPNFFETLKFACRILENGGISITKEKAFAFPLKKYMNEKVSYLILARIFGIPYEVGYPEEIWEVIERGHKN